MGRNRTPSAVLDAKGANIKNPQRRRIAEPKGGRPLGSPPKHLDEKHKAVWKEISSRMLPGVVFRSDRDAFELLVRLTVKLRDGDLDKAAQMTTLISLWSRFAMTPSDRSKVVAEQPKESQLSKFLKDRQGRTIPVPTPSQTEEWDEDEDEEIVQ
jgi:phage terminase small subunit